MSTVGYSTGGVSHFPPAQRLCDGLQTAASRSLALSRTILSSLRSIVESLSETWTGRDQGTAHAGTLASGSADGAAQRLARRTFVHELSDISTRLEAVGMHIERSSELLPESLLQHANRVISSIRPVLQILISKAQTTPRRRLKRNASREPS